jgi:membrane-bound serine protease (ClpP class)
MLQHPTSHRPRFSACVSALATTALLLTLCAFFTSRTHASLAARVVPAPASHFVLHLSIDGEIEPILADYISNGIDRANADHDSLIIITINTPGGLDTSMRQIIQKILASPVPVVTYVSPTGSRAASAGFFILLSADVVAMSPGTDTGAASPIMMFGGSTVQIDETLRHKIVNEANAYLRSYVSKRGRNVDLASTAVTDAKAFSEKEALDGHLIDLIEPNESALLTALNGRTITRFDGSQLTLTLSMPVVNDAPMNAREKFLSRIVQPDVFFILLIVAVLGIYAEFTHPGMFAPGVIGAIAAVMALYAMHLLPVNFTGLLLILVALGLFILEAKFPTHGVLGVGGAIAMILGALFLVRSPLTGMGVSWAAALGVTLPCAIIVIALMRLVLRSQLIKPSTGKEQLIGEFGEVTEPIGVGANVDSDVLSSVNFGMVFVHGELWRASANGEIPKGARVRVQRVKGLTLQVEPAPEPVRRP